MGKSIFLIFGLLIVACATQAQITGTYQIKGADTVKILKVGGSINPNATEFVLQNNTDTVPGFLFNTGVGITKFKRALTKINSTTYLVGVDTLTISSGGGSPGGATTNVQVNYGGALVGVNNFTFDTTKKTLTIGDSTNTLGGILYNLIVGSGNTSNGNYSASIGNANVTGAYSMSVGAGNIKTNAYSATFGDSLINTYPNSLVIGQFNDTTAWPNAATSGSPNLMPIFSIGNGVSNGVRANVFTILRNGSLVLNLFNNSSLDSSLVVDQNGNLIQKKFISGGGGGGGTIDSIGLTMPGGFTVTNSPQTGTGGTINVTSSLSGVVHANAGVFTGSQIVDADVTNVSWSKIISTPTTVTGYGISNAVRTDVTYANPSWITTLAWSKITGTPTTLGGYGITDPIVLTTGSYSNPAWITTLAWSKITSTPTTIAGYGITDNLVNTVNGVSGAVVVGSVDSIRHLFVDTSSHHNNYVLTFDSTNHKWFLSNASGAGVSTFAGLSDVSVTSPTNNQIPVYNTGTTKWTNTSVTTSIIAEGTNLYWTNARFDTRFATKTTDSLPQGTTNLYFTTAAARGAISGTAPISYSNSTGVMSLTFGRGLWNVSGSLQADTTIMSSLYYTGRFFDSVTTPTSNTLVFKRGNNTTDTINVPAISTLNGLTAATQSFAVGSAGTSPNISSVSATHTFNTPRVNASDTGVVTPALFNTWNAKEPAITAAATTDKYYNGYKQFVAFNTDSIAQGTTNLYFHSSDTAGFSAKATQVALNDTAVVLRGLIVSGFDSASSQGGGFHTQSYNDIRYFKRTDTGASSQTNITTWASRQKLSDSLVSLINLSATQIGLADTAAVVRAAAIVTTNDSTSNLRFALATKEPIITPADLAHYYWNGYKLFVPINTDSVSQGTTNLYFHASDTAGFSAKATQIGLTDTAAALRTAISTATGFDSASTQGGGFHTQPYNDIRYLNLFDTIGATGYTSLASRQKLSDSLIAVIGQRRLISDTLAAEGTPTRNQLYAVVDSAVSRKVDTSTKYHINIVKAGGRGINLLWGHDSTVVIKGLVDSSGFHWVLNADSTLTGFVDSTHWGSGGSGAYAIDTIARDSLDSIQSPYRTIHFVNNIISGTDTLAYTAVDGKNVHFKPIKVYSSDGSVAVQDQTDQHSIVFNLTEGNDTTSINTAGAGISLFYRGGSGSNDSLIFKNLNGFMQNPDSSIGLDTLRTYATKRWTDSLFGSYIPAIPTFAQVLAAGPNLSADVTNAFPSKNWILNAQGTGKFWLQGVRQDSSSLWGFVVKGNDSSYSHLSFVNVGFKLSTTGGGALYGTAAASFSSSQLAASLSDETGSGSAVFSVSPAFTGSPTVPTQMANDSSTKAASTQYVDRAVATGGGGGGGGTPGGPTNAIQTNNGAGGFAGSSNFLWDNTTLSVHGVVVGYNDVYIAGTNQNVFGLRSLSGAAGFRMGRSLLATNANDWFLYNDSLAKTSFNVTSTNKFVFPDSVQMTSGGPAANYVATSDAVGNISWQNKISVSNFSGTGTMGVTFGGGPAGSGSAYLTSASNVAGTINIVAGSGAGTGNATIFTLTPSINFLNSHPNIVLFPASSSAAGLQISGTVLWQNVWSNSSLQVAADATGTGFVNGTTYSWNYIIVQ